MQYSTSYTVRAEEANARMPNDINLKEYCAVLFCFPAVGCEVKLSDESGKIDLGVGG